MIEAVQERHRKQLNKTPEKGKFIQTKQIESDSLIEEDNECDQEFYNDKVTVAVSPVEEAEFASDEDEEIYDVPSIGNTEISDEEENEQMDDDESIVVFKRRKQNLADNYEADKGEKEEDEDEEIQELRRMPAFQRYMNKLAAKEKSENNNSLMHRLDKKRKAKDQSKLHHRERGFEKKENQVV